MGHVLGLLYDKNCFLLWQWELQDPQSFFFQRDESCYPHLEEQRLLSEQKLKSLSLPPSQMEVITKHSCVVWILWLTRNLLFALISFRQGCRKLWASWQSNSFVEKKITSSTMKSCLSPWLIHMGIVYTQGSLLSANPIQSSCWMAVGLCLFLICISDFCLVKFYSKSSQAVLSTKLK